MFVNKKNKQNDTLRFIELYKSHEVLWNMNLASYRRNDLKIKAYESICAETKMSVQEVKKKIKSFRTSYSAEKSKVENSKNSGCDKDSIYTPSVFWYSKMSFLDDLLMRRRTADIANKNKPEETSNNKEIYTNDGPKQKVFIQYPKTIPKPTIQLKEIPTIKSRNAVDDSSAFDLQCRTELHKLKMEVERRRIRNLDMEYELMQTKLQFYKNKILAGNPEDVMNDSIKQVSGIDEDSVIMKMEESNPLYMDDELEEETLEEEMMDTNGKMIDNQSSASEAYLSD